MLEHLFGDAVGRLNNRVVIKGSGRGVSLVTARRRGVLARPDGEEHGETGKFPPLAMLLEKFVVVEWLLKGQAGVFQ